jgi:hypothetical protein
MFKPLRWISIVSLTVIVALLAVRTAQAGKFPEPSPYPVDWELTFTHDAPKRIVVDVPGAATPQAYWYLKFTVTNNSDKEQQFLPVFEMMTNDGTVIRSDDKISPTVFDKIKQVEGDNLLEPMNKVAGTLRIGEDQAKDGVAIWREPASPMGNFTIFVGGLCGEHVEMKNDDGSPVLGADNQPVILRKTLRLDYAVLGDDPNPAPDALHAKGEKWVMR